MTPRQAEYHARRASMAEYNRRMVDPHGPGKNADRQDSALGSAHLAFIHKLADHGFATTESKVFAGDVYSWELDYTFREPDYYRGQLQPRQ